jgi:hypothetical protein
MTKRKVPDTCAKCFHSAKGSMIRGADILYWECREIRTLSGYKRIPCRPGRLPLPLKDCPRRIA